MTHGWSNSLVLRSLTIAAHERRDKRLDSFVVDL